MSMLILPIKKKWFDMIVSGQKKEEYREIKDYYDTRIGHALLGYPLRWCSKSLVEEKMKNETEEEYLRLLYVAITRAENELYICDSAKNNKPKENCWYEILRQAVENIGAKKKKIDNVDGDVLYIGDDDIFDLNIKDCVDNTSIDLSNDKEVENILSNISKNKEKVGETRIINPSTYYAENNLKNPHENSVNIEKGNMVHKLLEILPDAPKGEWKDIVDIYLKDKEYKDEIKEITLKVLNNKDFEIELIKKK